MRRVLFMAALAAVVALPFLLRPARPAAGAAERTVVVITPHNEAIRYEFGRGFAQWYRQRTGHTVAVDWRVIGGTSEITRFLAAGYVAAFERHWTGTLHRSWSAAIQGAFAREQLAPDASAEEREARAAFLASDVGCGIDVFFGGSSFDFELQAGAGRLVDSGLMRLHPDWFGEAVIPRTFTGQTYWDRDGRWFGAVLSNYGIIFNVDSLARLGVKQAPRAWDDLADPRLAGEVALCDPTKSSSMAQAFENILQEQINREWARQARETGRPPEEVEAAAVRQGWENGLRLIQRIGANARYFTDSSQKPLGDVQQGNSAAGICIDFYGRAEEQSVRERGGGGRLGYYSPPEGTATSCDPIGLLRGAPNREVAVAFLEYCLSSEGQRLWNLRPGTPGGPERYALRRLPIRKDFYAEAGLGPLRSDPDVNPYASGSPLNYQARWTGGIFRATAFVIRVMCQDAHAELAQAWRESIAAGMPEDALAALRDVSAVSYDEVTGRIKPVLDSRNKVEEVELARELAGGFRRQYLRAAALARAH